MKVSIIIPYNKDRGYLAEAIESAERQENFILNEDYEIIVQQGDWMLSKNFNDGFKKAKGKYIKILAEDDRLASGCLHYLYEKAKEGDYDVVCADAMNFDLDGTNTMVYKSRIPKSVHHLALENTLHGGTLLYKATALRAISALTDQPFNERMWTAEEYEVSLRLAEAGCRFAYTPEVVYYYRLHGEQKSGVYWQTDQETKLYRFEYIEKLQNQFWGNYTQVAR